MRYSIALVALLASVLVFFGGCSGVTAPTPASVVVTEAHNGTTITLAPGGKLTVRLVANPSTGYQWLVAKTPTAQVLRATGSGYEPPVSTLLGAPGVSWWTYDAASAGTTSLDLRYVRPWEAATAAQQFTLQIVVR